MIAIEIPEVKLSKAQVETLRALRDGMQVSDNRNWRRTFDVLRAQGLVALVWNAQGFGHYELTAVGHCELAIAEGLWH